MMNIRVEKSAVALANVLLLAAIVVFASGFFPYKAFLPGLATWPQGRSAAGTTAPFDKVIFMVVDALRSDFVYSNTSNFAFTQDLIRHGAAIPFTGHASPPTITMPRVKAITTGSVPSFVDLVLNFAESDTSSTLATQDSWLAQMRAKQTGKMVMYGDDTWLRLFPGFFDRSDGTTSFFVSDFTEVDNNVTRHIPSELEKDDWSVMTLHFLGLDHIGHKTGPKGPNMPAKQTEMDGIVRTIYEALDSQQHLKSTLLVLLGDHGMNEAGNHGASSAGEVSTALTFISPTFKSTFNGVACPAPYSDDFRYYDEVEQSDIAPTLAALLGFPVPRNNLGIIIPRLLDLWTKEQDRALLLHDNAQQIHEIAQATFPSAFTLAPATDPCSVKDAGPGEDLACQWSKIMHPDLKSSKTQVNTANLRQIQLFLSQAQRILSSTASNYDVSKLYFGLILCGFALASCVPAFYTAFKRHGLGDSVFMLLCISYSITMFASSYVEEEHQFWYWALGGWLAFLYCNTARFRVENLAKGRRAIALVFLLLGLTRRWKQTGQKYAGDPDLLSEVITGNPWLLWALIIVTFAYVSRSLSKKAGQWMENSRMAVLPVLVSMSVFVFKVAFTAADAPELLQTVVVLQPLVSFVSKYSLVNLARVVFLGLGHLTLCAVYYEKPWMSIQQLRSFWDTIHEIVTLFLIAQSRTVFIPLFLAFGIQLQLLGRRTVLSPADISLASLLFQFTSFFAFGGTNAISSVDLSNAYNGISGFNVVAVGALTFISNWAGPIWWSVGTCRLLVRQKAVAGNDDAAFHHFARLTFFMIVSTAAVMTACTVLREHLFIWTVFSPKYLYTVAWVFGQHIFVNGLCTLMLGG